MRFGVTRAIRHFIQRAIAAHEAPPDLAGLAYKRRQIHAGTHIVFLFTDEREHVARARNLCLEH